MTEKKPAGLLYPGETLDELRHWGLWVIQSKDGYRFGIDSLLLAALANPPKKGLVLDMGTGCGVLSLILARRFSNVRICAVEIQKSLARRAKRNAEMNRLSDSIRVVEGSFTDLNEIVEGDSFDYVITNPPYYQAESGRTNPVAEKAIARHELHGDLGNLIDNAFYALKFRGKIGMIFDALRTVDLVSKMREGGIEPKLIRFIHSLVNKEAKLVFVEGVKGGKKGETRVAPPMVVYKRPHNYHDEVNELIGAYRWRSSAGGF